MSVCIFRPTLLFLWSTLTWLMVSIQKKPQKLLHLHGCIVHCKCDCSESGFQLAIDTLISVEACVVIV